MNFWGRFYFVFKLVSFSSEFANKKIFCFIAFCTSILNLIGFCFDLKEFNIFNDYADYFEGSFRNAKHLVLRTHLMVEDIRSSNLR